MFCVLQVRVEGHTYVGAGNSTSKKDAQTNAAKDFVQYLVRSGLINEAEVPQTAVSSCQIVRMIRMSLPSPHFMTSVNLSLSISSQLEAAPQVEDGGGGTPGELPSDRPAAPHVNLGLGSEST